LTADDVGSVLVGVPEVYEMLAELVRRGPGHVVTYGLGILTVALILLSIHWLAKRTLSRRVERLRDENDQLHGEKAAIEFKFQAARVENEKLLSDWQTLAEEADDLRQDKARLEVRLECAQEDNRELRSARHSSTRENVELREARARLEAQLESASEERKSLYREREALTAESGQLHQLNARLEAVLESTQRQGKHLRETLEALSDELEAYKVNEGDLTRQVSELSEQVQRLADFDGRVWERPPTVMVPEFRPLSKRQVPVIAIANLKGGVGKTTLTANLGAVLAQRNQRVLLVDLDYRGSLTSLCLTPAEIREIRRRRQFVDRLFQEHKVEPELLTQCSQRISQLSGLRLLAADEPLADVENRVMAQWLLNPNDQDARFLLRSYLHSEAVRYEYDCVLIDCPPRLTTACINAVAAADFLLMPVLLDRTSAEAVPRQLWSLRKLKRVMGSDLAVLGLVANRTHPRQQLISRESDVWESLAGPCEDRWGQPVYQFSTVIRQHAAFAEAARADGFAALYRDLQPMFFDFIEEIQTRIAEIERQGSSAVPPESQASA
jgi:chromosome partitioning protein